MDTDDLSREAYDGILIEAEKLTHDLTFSVWIMKYVQLYLLFRRSGSLTSKR